MAVSNIWYWVVNDKSGKNAGLRVRTRPIISRLKTARFRFEITTPDELFPILDSEKSSTHILGVIISKPSDSSSALLIQRLKNLNIPVIIDIFDNYYAYSPAAYQRGIYWQWLSLLNMADGVICSTPVLEDWVHKLRSNIPIMQVNDPLPWHQLFNEKSVITRWGELQNKWKKNVKVRKLLWFGMPTNPWYLLGIADLLKWRDLIADLIEHHRNNYQIELVICTNACPEVTQAIGAFTSLGINTRFVSWTAEACAKELDGAHCVLIPTASNDFSRAKTHNRLSESVNRGCLVFSSSIGPYEQYLGGVVTDDLSRLEDMLFSQDEVQLGKTFELTVSNLDRTIDFNKQTAALGISLEKIRLSKTDDRQVTPPYLVMVVGNEGYSTVVKRARKYGYLIAGYTAAKSDLTYDFFLTGVDAEECSCQLKISNKARALLNDLAITDFDEISEDVIKVKMQEEYRPIFKRIELIDASGINIGKLQTECHSLNIYILGRLINKIGLMQLLVNSNSSEVWQGFGLLTDSDLLNTAKNLEQVWESIYA